MKENSLLFKELTDNQRRIYTDSAQVYEAFMDAFGKSRSYAGGMHWKTVKGRDYLFRTLTRKGTGKSLGVRSPHTENIYAQFHRAKQTSDERLANLKSRLAEQARFCKAALIQRTPRVVTALLRLLEQKGMLGRNLIVIGTNALFAYEAAAGGFFDAPLMATGDADLLFDPRRKLTMAIEEGSPRIGLLDLLRKIDRSFEQLGTYSYRAVNREGYMVDLIKPIPDPPWKTEPSGIGREGDLVAVGTRKLEWIASSPKFSQIVIGEDGFPARMVVPDPRVFAFHKLWLSEQDDREPVKKRRDKAQAEALFYLTLNYLPQYPLDDAVLRMLPGELLKRGKKLVEEDLPPGFEQ